MSPTESQGPKHLAHPLLFSQAPWQGAGKNVEHWDSNQHTQGMLASQAAYPAAL